MEDLKMRIQQRFPLGEEKLERQDQRSKSSDDTESEDPQQQRKLYQGNQHADEIVKDFGKIKDLETKTQFSKNIHEYVIDSFFVGDFEKFCNEEWGDPDASTVICKSANNDGHLIFLDTQQSDSDEMPKCADPWDSYQERKELANQKFILISDLAQIEQEILQGREVLVRITGLTDDLVGFLRQLERNGVLQVTDKMLVRIKGQEGLQTIKMFAESVNESREEGQWSSILVGYYKSLKAMMGDLRDITDVGKWDQSVRHLSPYLLVCRSVSCAQHCHAHTQAIIAFPFLNRFGGIGHLEYIWQWNESLIKRTPGIVTENQTQSEAFYQSPIKYRQSGQETRYFGASFYKSLLSTAGSELDCFKDTVFHKVLKDMEQVCKQIALMTAFIKVQKEDGVKSVYVPCIMKRLTKQALVPMSASVEVHGKSCMDIYRTFYKEWVAKLEGYRKRAMCWTLQGVDEQGNFSRDIVLRRKSTTSLSAYWTRY